MLNKMSVMTAKVIKNISEKIADISYGTASIFSMHQPKEPKKPELLKKIKVTK